MTDTYTQQAWSLDDLYTAIDSPEIEATLTDLEARVTAFEKVRPELSAELSHERFMEIIGMMDALMVESYKLFSFAQLSFYQDTQDQAAQSLLGSMQQTFARLQNRILFFELWWKGLDDADAKRLTEGTGDYHYWLEEMRNYKPYTLSEAEEKVINIKNVTGWEGIRRIYESMTNRYVFKMEVDGEVKEMTRGELMVYARSAKPELREAAYQELYKVYGDDGSVLGQMYQTLIQDWHNENIDMRSFPSSISVRNVANDIPDEAVDALLGVCEENAELFQRFFRLKAKWLGVERLRRYDVYAPVAEADKEYGFQEAVDLVLESFNKFDGRVADLARRVFEEDRLDSEVRKGKYNGAFCFSTTPKVTPWVLVNFQGRPDDVATMAHELGHAIHSMLAEDHNVFTFHATLPLAENASTFGEMMLVDQMLKLEQDPAVRRDILFRQVDDAYATIMRQAFFALFERTAHAMIQEGATIDQLNEAYIENLKKQFGDSIELSEEFQWEWVSIPHIYDRPFYVYAYAFGQLLVLSLYQRYLQEGESFIPGYIKILEAGGSESPTRILSEAGIDICSPEFWQGGFDVVKGMIEELEALPIEK